MADLLRDDAAGILAIEDGGLLAEVARRYDLPMSTLCDVLYRPSPNMGKQRFRDEYQRIQSQFYRQASSSS